jgi:hypothetical protein
MTLEQARKQELFSALLDALRAQVTIEVLNQRVLEN